MSISKRSAQLPERMTNRNGEDAPTRIYTAVGSSKIVRSFKFPLPQLVGLETKDVLQYWNGLKRAGNDIPFADDLSLDALSRYSDDIFLIDVFEKPMRFCVSQLGKQVAALYGNDLPGRFLDDVEVETPIDGLAAQCEETVSGWAPTYHIHKNRGGYARILLPLWADGRISMLLGALFPANIPLHVDVYILMAHEVVDA